MAQFTDRRRNMEMNSYIDLLIGLVIAIGAWWCKTQHSELQRITVLLNRTREEIALGSQCELRNRIM